MAIDTTTPIPPIQPHECLLIGRMWVSVALDKLNKIDDPGYYEQEVLILVESALDQLEYAVRKLGD